jgi:hypothetical protein
MSWLAKTQLASRQGRSSIEIVNLFSLSSYQHDIRHIIQTAGNQTSTDAAVCRRPVSRWRPSQCRQHRIAGMPMRSYCRRYIERRTWNVFFVIKFNCDSSLCISVNIVTTAKDGRQNDRGSISGGGGGGCNGCFFKTATKMALWCTPPYNQWVPVNF